MSNRDKVKTTNIDPEAVKKLIKNEQLATQAADHVKGVFGDGINQESYDQIRKLAYNIIVNNPNIRLEKLSPLLEVSVKKSPTLLTQNPKNKQANKAETKKGGTKKPTSKRASETKKPISTMDKIRRIAKRKNPTVSDEILDQSMDELEAGVEAEVFNRNPLLSSVEESKQNVKEIIKSPSLPIKEKSLSSIKTAKEAPSLKIIDAIPPEYIGVLRDEKHQELVEKFADTPEALPPHSTKDSELIRGLVKDMESSRATYKAIIQRGGFKPFLNDFERSYRYIYTQRSSAPIRSSGSFLKRIWSQLSGKGGVRSNHSQVVLKTIRHFSPETTAGLSPSLTSNPLKSILSKTLGSPIKNGLSTAKTGLGSLLKKGGGAMWSGAKQLASTAGKSLVTFLSELTLSNPYVLGFVVLVFAIIGLIILIDNYDSFTTQVAHTIPSGQGGGVNSGSQSRYARITKTASITTLEDPVGEISYTYTITPLDGGIAVNSFSDTTSIFQESGQRGLDLNSPPEVPPDIISHEFTSLEFSLSLESNMDDSIIMNEVTLVFINPEGVVETIKGVATSIVGTPPTQCLALKNNSVVSPSGEASVSWDTDPTAKQFVLTAIAKTLESPTYAAILCSGGVEIPVYLVRSSLTGGGWFSGASIFLFGVGGSSGGVWSQGAAIYTLAHETGHAIHNSQHKYFDQFREANIMTEEGWIHTYPGTKSNSEDFAETIGLYVAENLYSESHWGSFSFSSRYPLHYNFAHQTMFGGYEY